MYIRKLRDAGILEMEKFLDSLETSEPLPYPSHILEDPRTSDSVGIDVEIDRREFDSRFAFASYIDGVFAAAGLSGSFHDKYLWSWLALFYFEQICPRDKNGAYHPKARARWVPEMDDFQRYYRHLLAGPYMIYWINIDKPERALALLCGSLASPGEVVEQLISRQEFVFCKTLVAAATHLYYDPNLKKLKRGSGGKGPGSPRRLAADVLPQFDLTWDFYSMSEIEFVQLLPSEFDRFRSAS